MPRGICKIRRSARIKGATNNDDDDSDVNQFLNCLRASYEFEIHE